MTHEDQWMETLRVRLLRGMREYMARVVVPYDESHVQECDGILVEHARALAMAAGERDARRIVRATVANLNALNARCRGMLIETDQREDIGEYIIRAGRHGGVARVVAARSGRRHAPLESAGRLRRRGA